MSSDQSVIEYMDLLASDAPAPGGGSAAAMAGALGAALAHMVGALTAGRAKYAEHADFNAGLLERTQRMQAEFLALADEDAAVFGIMSAAYKMPKNTADEKAARKAAIQSASKICALTPYKLMGLCKQALELTAQAVGKTNKNVASDLGVAALCLKAALQSAWLNVAINLGGLDDVEFAAEYRSKCEAILAEALPAADGIYDAVL